jgi:hypothetical protein
MNLGGKECYEPDELPTALSRDIGRQIYNLFLILKEILQKYLLIARYFEPQKLSKLGQSTEFGIELDCNTLHNLQYKFEQIEIHLPKLKLAPNNVDTDKNIPPLAMLFYRFC